MGLLREHIFEVGTPIRDLLIGNFSSLGQFGGQGDLVEMFSSSDTKGEDEAEMLEDEVVQVDRVVMKEEDESGEFRQESSNMYQSISSKNSSMPSWYMAITKFPSISRYTSRIRRDRTVC